ncbi:HAD family phosphatase [candidate division KSB1 bacterium]|nr:HAD family phosphatase [candidate division KSB1 bacterium]
MISTIIFDLGNVLVEVERKRLVDNFKRQLNNHFNFEELTSQLRVSPAIKHYELGEINSDQFYQAFSQELHLKIDISVMKRCWQDIFKAIPETISLLPILKMKYKLAMISDTNPWHTEIIEEENAIFNYFNELIFSYEVHAAKPDPQIFNIALARLHSPAASCVYIDDLEANVAAAKKLGMHGVLYNNPSDLKRDLQALDITLNP